MGICKVNAENYINPYLCHASGMPTDSLLTFLQSSTKHALSSIRLAVAVNSSSWLSQFGLTHNSATSYW